ncbi:multiple RNA-binding domain-containing protein 1 [Trichonephila clavipes]|nr:multiple RNA-binding domain-containing protein 1 [Trichonephila clavipes]
MNRTKKPQDEEMDDDSNIELDDDAVLYWFGNHKAEDDDNDSEDDEEQEQRNDVNTPVKGADKSEKPQTSKAKTPKNEIQEKGSSAEMSEIFEEAAERRERDLRTLFVGNLPAKTTPNELKALSSDITEVIHRRKSYCFIRFASEEKADANYKALQGKELKGHLLNVDYMGEKCKNIKKKETKGEISLETLYVGNLPVDVTSDELKALSADIEAVCLPKKCSNPNKFAFITFASKEEAYANYKALQGEKLRVSEKMVECRLLEFLESKGIISDCQAGFERYRSSMNQVVKLTQAIKDDFHHNKSTLAVLVDFKAACDNVWHNMMLHKLKKITGNIQ